MIRVQIAAVRHGRVYLDAPSRALAPALNCLVRCVGPTGHRRGGALLLALDEGLDDSSIRTMPEWPAAWCAGDTIYFDEQESP